jgi:branched-chain amino acid transport system ATP-binding protein
LAQQHEPPLLDVKRLQATYGRVTALKGVSLSVPKGSIVSVLGANGAGKSTLLLSIMGRTTQNAEGLLFNGKDIRNLNTSERVGHGISLVPEGRRILVSMTVEENLLLGASCRNDTEVVHKEIDALMERFPNLGSRRNALAATLSGGEQQMLAVARALLAKPQLLLLDEPSLGLSPKFVANLFSLLHDLRRDGLTILLVEQNTQKALEIADTAYVLKLGTVVLEGSAAEVRDPGRLEAAYLGGH